MHSVYDAHLCAVLTIELLRQAVPAGLQQLIYGRGGPCLLHPLQGVLQLGHRQLLLGCNGA